MQPRRRAYARALLLAKGRGHSRQVEDRVHLGMHRYGLPVPARTHVRTVVVRSVMIVTAGYDLSAFDEDGAEREAHRALRGRIGALREIKLGLVHILILFEEVIRLIGFSCEIERKQRIEAKSVTCIFWCMPRIGYFGPAL